MNNTRFFTAVALVLAALCFVAGRITRSHVDNAPEASLLTKAPAPDEPIQVGRAVRHSWTNTPYGFLQMETDKYWRGKELPRFAMWTEQGGWGYIRLTNIQDVAYLEQELGIKLVLQGNWGDDKYAPGTLPICDSSFRPAWLTDHTNNGYSTNVPSEFLIVVNLDKWWWKH